LHNVISILKKGLGIFEYTAKQLGEDFTLYLYNGDYLLEFARLGYNFQHANLLRDAKQKLLVAQQLGKGFYSQPFISLAKVALHLHGKIECLAVLQTCKTTFTTDYATYTFDNLLEDKDFGSIWQELTVL